MVAGHVGVLERAHQQCGRLAAAGGVGPYPAAMPDHAASEPDELRQSLERLRDRLAGLELPARSRIDAAIINDEIDAIRADPKRLKRDVSDEQARWPIS